MEIEEGQRFFIEDRGEFIECTVIGIERKTKDIIVKYYKEKKLLGNHTECVVTCRRITRQNLWKLIPYNELSKALYK